MKTKTCLARAVSFPLAPHTRYTVYTFNYNLHQNNRNYLTTDQPTLNITDLVEQVKDEDGDGVECGAGAGVKKEELSEGGDCGSISSLPDSEAGEPGGAGESSGGRGDCSPVVSPGPGQAQPRPRPARAPAVTAPPGSSSLSKNQPSLTSLANLSPTPKSLLTG